MKKLNAKGFTLIELLVVITIIGILATGATAVYTSAQQKARDSIRQNDVLTLKSAVEQVFGDNAQYPKTPELYKEIVTDGKYMAQLPDDPKSGQADSTTQFIYIYGASQDETTTVAGQEYEISANFENAGNSETKEKKASDTGDDDERWEVGINVGHVITTTAATTPWAVNGTNNYGGTNSAGDGIALSVDSCASSTGNCS